MRPLSQFHTFTMIDYVMLSLHHGYPIIDDNNLHIKINIPDVKNDSKNTTVLELLSTHMIKNDIIL